jgi:hypothetical protein
VPGDESDDYFHRLTLDDEFVRGASNKEPAASDRARLAYRQSMAQHEQAQLAEQLRAANRTHRRLGRWGRRQRGRGIFVLVIAAIGVASYFDLRQPSESIGWDTAEPSFESVDSSRVPTAKAAASKTPLGTAPEAPNTNEPFAFIRTQPGSSRPVAYDPCRPISVVINDSNAPAGTTQVINDAIEKVSAATGLQFVVEGATDEPVGVEQRAFQPDRYGDRWAPVWIGWSDATVVKELDGDVIGLGGSVGFARGASEPEVYVTGEIVLDLPDVEELLEERDGFGQLETIVLHELAHVVGLDHVDDKTQVMNPEGTGVMEFQSGDLAGLAQLGQGACIAKL